MVEERERERKGYLQKRSKEYSAFVYAFGYVPVVGPPVFLATFTSLKSPGELLLYLTLVGLCLPSRLQLKFGFNIKGL
jgi:hypothetical protein